ncbi:unnamed protein product [Tilletia controversa]|uniref:Uncharacterized protein n=3 Tax=Tilletia TaxID=13289 RepID=A0A8X7N068_9BASI|nr:hypothetical protein CF336_g281 [Tilletia laevis]KAE8202352.1 hypothetical protein CF328_g2258 [Tilletia controversa]KAE8265531.1 hypothetical protein A4X03_0g200 [Tilletia caries]KAE8206782.1 hypothetical protein CF335_g1615 [Tilletia laevis]KAE8255325.1 hypothetical protein A4X06_0g478 [Tilletia controversa]
MQFFIATALVAAALVAAQSTITVYTPNAITTCIANRLTWTGGVAPYSPFIIVPLKPENILDTLEKTNEQFVVYKPDGTTSGIEVGANVAVYVVDSQGQNAGSAGTNVVAGGSCAGSASSSAASSSTSAAAVASSISSSAASAPTTTRVSTSTSNTATRSTSSSSTATSAPANGASAGLKVSGGLIAGVAGLLAVVLA